MAKRKGLFIVLEGIDGSGTTTQLGRLHDHIRGLSKYADVLTTHEPWDNDEIKRMLAEDRDAYSDGEKMTQLYVEDRRRHLLSLVNPNVSLGVDVLSDRFAMSTFAYQGTQGVDIKAIKQMHSTLRVPDLTYFLDVDYETARRRINLRGEALEKFEGNEKFTRRLIEAYRDLAKNETSLGRVVTINGNNHIEQVTADIVKNFGGAFGHLYKK